MRSGICRGLAVAIALGAAFACGPALTARADLFHHTIPRETLALDYRTGDVMMAPPIPDGLYAKDPIGCVKNAAGVSFGAIHGLAGKLHGLCSKCGGAACGTCGGGGLFHGKACGACGGDGCGRCGSGGLGLGHGGGDGCGLGIGGLFHHGDGALGHLGHKGGHGMGGACAGLGCGTQASGQLAATPTAPAKTLGAPQIMSSGQMPAAVCGGCLGTGHLLQGGGCGLCGGTGRLRNLLGHGGGNACGSCGGRGCGACGGLGGQASPCDGCGGRGCGLCGGRGLLGGLGQNGLCRGCGGRGCGLCAGMKGKGHSLHGLAAKVLHKGQIKYFVGPGGPVPLTPGYVPYVVTTRSPRDFLAFPPFSDQIP
jgi:hypothetical protein